MEDSGNHQSSGGGKLLPEESIAVLFKNAGPRRTAPAEIKAEIFQATQEAWRFAQKRRRRRRNWIALAAIFIVATVGLGLWMARPESALEVEIADATAAGVAVVDGWLGADGARPFQVGEELAVGVEVTTLDGEKAALLMASGTSLRLDHSSRVRLLSAARVELLSGAVYVDTRQDGGESRIEISTRFGTLRDIGTQFEVRLEPDNARLRVRTGEVRVEAGAGQALVGAGAELSINSAGGLERADASSYDWAWALQIAPSRHLIGASLAEILRFVERETGWAVRYEDAALAAEAEQITAGGSLEALHPDEIPEILVPAAGLNVTRRSGHFVIRRP